MPVIPEGIAYAYTHETTQATTGYFSCQPPAQESYRNTDQGRDGGQHGQK